MPSSLHKNPPFKAHHLGSLVRPDYLLQAREAFEKNPANQERLRKAEDKAMKQSVQAHLIIGFNCISDGKYRRHSKNLTHRNAHLDEPLLTGAPVVWVPSPRAWTVLRSSNDRALTCSSITCLTLLLSWEPGHGPVESVLCVNRIRHIDSMYTEQWGCSKTLLPPMR